MGEKIGLWALNSSDGGREVADSLEELKDTETEQRLEDLLVQSPDVLLPGLTLLGRQMPTLGGPLDLLGVDPDGRLVIFELKRGTLTRDAVAQILDYASDLIERDPEEMAALIEESSVRLGADPIDDFLDWYQQEFPDVSEPPPARMRLVLVGLGVDERAKRIVNFLARTGLDIQLLTFQAFKSDSGVLLARRVETIDPTLRDGTVTGGQKQRNLRELTELARTQEVEVLLREVADFIDERLPSYRWPGKTGFTYHLPERTEQGTPTQRAYASLWVDRKSSRQVIVSLPDRAIETAPRAVSHAVSTVPSARRRDNSWTPFELIVTAETWPELSEPLNELLSAVVEAWKQKVERQNAEDSAIEPEEVVESAAGD